MASETAGTTKPDLVPLTREQDIEARRLYYEGLQERLAQVLESQAAQGRWLIASLLLVHGGLFGFLAQSERLASYFLPQLFWWLVAGLIAALMCGFVTWWNWTFAANIYASSHPWMIYTGQAFEAHWKHGWAVTLTLWLAVIFGLVSVACLIGAAVTGFELIHSVPHDLIAFASVDFSRM